MNDIFDFINEKMKVSVDRKRSNKKWCSVCSSTKCEEDIQSIIDDKI